MHVCLVSSVVSDSGIPWTVAHKAPLSLGFSRQEYWSGSPFSPPGDLPNAGIKPTSPTASALASKFLPLSPLGNPQSKWYLPKRDPSGKKPRCSLRNKIEGRSGFHNGHLQLQAHGERSYKKIIQLLLCAVCY